MNWASLRCKACHRMVPNHAPLCRHEDKLIADTPTYSCTVVAPVTAADLRRPKGM